MIYRVTSIIGLVALLLALLLMNFTTPSEVGPVGILVFFVLIYVFCLILAFLVLSFTIRLLARFLSIGKIKVRLESLSQRKIYYYSSIIGLAPVILLGLRSVGRVSILEVSLVIIFEIIGIFYISRRF